ncbi:MULTISPECIES: DUF4190 domain-containing protein [unclassified Streptomyces]|uniref:DUF4190 domain-containing protein n=1 Tax=unclassified Streptomyces TaxID=2593676 RepID=UPI0033BCF9E0|nr:DUF4190 domain-containing protein [Streptomyces sp. NBC_01176]
MSRPVPETAQTSWRRDPYSLAAASFVLGLVGLLVFNLVLGPTAVVLGLVALHRGTTHRHRAYLGILLGATDLIVLALVTAADHTVAWHI